MANSDSPLGFRPVEGNGTTARMRRYQVAAAYTEEIGQFSLVKIVLGYAERWDTVGATAKEILGSAVHNVQSTGALRYVWVYDDPDQTFIAQMDDNSQTTELEYIGNCFAPTSLTVVGSATGISGQEIDGGTEGNASTTNFIQTIGISRRLDNDVTAANTKVHCKIIPLAHVYGVEQPAQVSA